MMFNRKFETMTRKSLEALQSKRLKALVERVYDKVPYYKGLMDKSGLKPGGIKNIKDLHKLPFATKEDLRLNYPFGLFAVPLKDVVRIHASSGTTGKPTVVGYTKNDIKTWSNLVARVMTAGGVTKDDVVQIAFGYGLFTGGFGLHYGAERIGASVIPISSGNTRRQIKIMQDFKTTALVCTPSYALLIADTIMEMGINTNSLSLKYGLFGAEPWSEGMRAEIQNKLKIIATDNYGLSEVMGPGVAGECLEQSGLHVNEDHFIIEIINPDTLEPVKTGEVGELVITTLTKEAFPVIRFRTRDLAKIIEGQCPCGRTFRRISRVMGRTDDMLIIKGVNVFPTQIETVLFDIEGIAPHYQIIIDRKGQLDEATVMVEVSEEIFFDQMRKQNELVDLIQKRLASELGVGMDVKLVEKKSIERFEGKAVRVIDKRKLS